MDEFINITIFILFVFGIFQIILFFKVWGMTNNVKKLLAKTGNRDYLTEASIAYLKGEIEKTKELVDAALYQELAIGYNNASSYGEWENILFSLKGEYKKIYNKIGEEMPDIDKYKDPKNHLTEV